MATRSLNVAITGDSRSLNRALDQTEGRTKRWGGRMAKGMGVAGAAAGAAFAGGLSKAAQAAIESEKAQKSMEAQLKASGISFKDHAKEIDNVIQKTSKLAGLDDEDLQKSFTNIVRATGDVDKGLRLTGTAADLARAKHIDVAKAGEIVGKVAAGNTGILGRYGIKVKEGASAQEALAEMQKRFGGQAEAYGKTTAGAMDRAQVASENLGEAVGAKLTPMLAKSADALVSVVEAVQEHWPKVRRIVGGVIDAVVGFIRRFRKRNEDDIEGVVSALRKVGRFFQKIFEDVIVPTVKRVLPPLRDAMEGIVRIIRGLVRVASGIINGDWKKVWSGVKDIVGGALTALRGVIRGSWELLKGVVVRLGKKLVGGIADGLKGIAKAVKNGIVSGFKAGINEAGKVLDKLNPLSSITGNIIKDAGDAGRGIAGSIPGGAFLGAGGGGNTSGLQIEARTGLGFLRRQFGGLTLSSGYRSPAENARVGGAPNSDHLTGLGTDLVPAEGWTFSGINRLDRIAAWARKSPLIRWIGWRGVKGHGPGNHLHLSWVDRMRGDVRAAAGMFGRHPKERVIGMGGGRAGDVLGRFDSTAYGPPWNAMNGTGVTATGVNLKGAPRRYGVAVDPDVIPLGTRLKISPNPFGYGGFFTAFDTGGAIQGNRIDFYDWRGRSAQMRWGHRSVSVSTADGGGGGGRRRGPSSAVRGAAQRFAASQRATRNAAAQARARAEGNRTFSPVRFGPQFGRPEPVPWWEQEAAAGSGEGDPAAEALRLAIEANTAAVTAHKESLDGVNAEMKRQTDFATSTMATDKFQALKMATDMISGQFGRGMLARSFTAGAGVEVAYAMSIWQIV